MRNTYVFKGSKEVNRFLCSQDPNLQSTWTSRARRKRPKRTFPTSGLALPTGRQVEKLLPSTETSQGVPQGGRSRKQPVPLGSIGAGSLLAPKGNQDSYSGPQGTSTVISDSREPVITCLLPAVKGQLVFAEKGKKGDKERKRKLQGKKQDTLLEERARLHCSLTVTQEER